MPSGGSLFESNANFEGYVLTIFTVYNWRMRFGRSDTTTDKFRDCCTRFKLKVEETGTWGGGRQEDPRHHRPPIKLEIKMCEKKETRMIGILYAILETVYVGSP